jgi:hypothetical protein
MTEDTARATLKLVLENGITAYPGQDGHWYWRVPAHKSIPITAEIQPHLLLLQDVVREIELDAVSAG